MRRALVVLALLAAVVVVGGGSAGAQGPAPAPEYGSSDWRVVATGGQHTCGIRTSGRLYCWGEDGDGQLGDGGSNDYRVAPTEVVGGETDWKQVAVGGRHTCARRATGRLYCWGDDTYGQLGDGGTNTDQTVPTQVAGSSTDWAQISASGLSTCARRTTGRLFCWGDDTYGQLGDGGTNTAQTTPVEVAGGTTDWAQVSVGETHTCGRRVSGRLSCWGDDTYGQLGDGGTNTGQPEPVLVAGRPTDWRQVVAGGAHTCARRANGRAYCWGADSYGQVGDGGTNTDRPIPTQVAGAATDWTTITAGETHTCGRRATGRLYCWGDDTRFGQLGRGGNVLSDQSAPAEVAGGATDWVDVSAGSTAWTTCARITSRRLFCWGANGLGQIGDGTTEYLRNEPVPVRA